MKRKSLRKKSLRRKSLRRKSLRKKSLRKKSLKSLKRSLRKKSLRKNDNGGSFSKDKDTKDDDIESLKRHVPVMSLLNLNDDIFKEVWKNETIKEKYLNNMGMYEIEPFEGKYSTENFNRLLSESTNKEEFKSSAKKYFVAPKENLLKDLNNIINSEIKKEDKLELFKGKSENLITFLINKLSS